MKKIRVGIIGIGQVAQARHIPRLKQDPDVELVSAWAPKAEKARAAAEKAGIKHTAASWEEIARSGEVDAVVIATPPVLHLPATKLALESGKHVLSQARMARNLKESHEMLRLAKQHSKLVTALYPPLPGLKGDRVMERLIKKEGFVGEIREVRVTGLAYSPASDEYNWRYDPEASGVNAMTLGMWAEVLHRWVGPAKTVAAIGRTYSKTRKDRDGKAVPAGVPDSIGITAQLENGAIATYHFATGAAAAPDQAIEIYGSKGALVYKLFGDEIRAGAAGAKALEPIEIPAAEVRNQTTDLEWIRAIRDGTPVRPDFDEGVRYMEFSEAVALSMKSGKTVTLPMQPSMDSWGKLIG
ncbi:MAG: Gfo/Idh/MocA family oxidoreductase [SAR202 cluster bacterium]|nr:Gfo/Idh/MocA family oxidoreductase [SAR202 cluster bacterium]